MVPKIKSEIASALSEAGSSPMLAPLISARPLIRLACFMALTAITLLASAVAFAIILLAIPQLGNRLEGVDVLPEGPLRLVEESYFAILLAMSLSLIGLSIVASAALTWRRPLQEFLWPGRRFSSRQLGIGFAFMILIAALLFPVSLVMGGEWDAPVFDPKYAWPTRVLYAGVMAGSLFIAAAAEEVVFRGVLLRLSGILTRQPLLVCIVNGLLFSAIHLDPDPVAFVARAASGMIWTWAALRLGGLEFAIGAHFANNLFITLFLSPLSDGFLVRRADWIELLPEAVVVLLTLAAIEWLARRKGKGSASIDGPTDAKGQPGKAHMGLEARP